MPRKYTAFLVTLLFWLSVDQLTKYLTIQRLRVGVDEFQILPGWLSFVHAQNFGAAFSSMEGQFWLFIGFTAIATVVVLDLVRRMKPDETFMAVMLGMILSGAWGNGLDRIRIGHVTDFIRVYTEHPGLKTWFIENFGTNTWPIFNVADSVLLIGISVFLVHYLFLEEDVPESADTEAALEDL